MVPSWAFLPCEHWLCSIVGFRDSGCSDLQINLMVALCVSFILLLRGHPPIGERCLDEDPILICFRKSASSRILGK